MADAENVGKAAGFALGMTRQDGELAVRWSVDGTEEVRPLEVLRNPMDGGASLKVSVTTDLADWTEVPSQDWAAGLGFAHSTAVQIEHRVWRVKLEGAEALFPAQALLQGLLRPALYVLQEIFRPQSIDGICTMLDGVPVPLASWPAARHSMDSAIFRGPMTWVHCFPSARRMAASIYDLATKGVLGCDLASGCLSGVVHGVANGNRLYVTRFVPTAINTCELPFPFAEGTSGAISVGESDRRLSTMTGIPLREGDFQLSNEEWDELEALLPCRPIRVHSPRTLVDAILSRVCGQTQKADKNAALARASLGAYQRWKRGGHWDLFSERLIALRGGPQVGEKPRFRRKPISSGHERFNGVDTGLRLDHFGPLSDSEWENLVGLVNVRAVTAGMNSSRAVFNKMLAGLAAGREWGTNPEDGYSIANAAAHRYQSFVKDGRWPKIAERLNQIRPLKSER